MLWWCLGLPVTTELLLLDSSGLATRASRVTPQRAVLVFVVVAFLALGRTHSASDLSRQWDIPGDRRVASFVSKNALCSPSLFTGATPRPLRSAHSFGPGGPELVRENESVRHALKQRARSLGVQIEAAVADETR